MKKIRFFSLAMVLLLVFAALVACQPVVDPDNGEEIDDTKTQLYVYVAKWGFGTDWFKQSKKEYEELNKDRVFEEGKKGYKSFRNTVKATCLFRKSAETKSTKCFSSKACRITATTPKNCLPTSQATLREKIPTKRVFPSKAR